MLLPLLTFLCPFPTKGKQSHFTLTTERMKITSGFDWMSCLDILTCIAMYWTGYYLLYYGRSIEMGFRFSDSNIQKPLVPLAISFRLITYGSLIGTALLLCLIEVVWASRDVEKLYIKFFFGWLCVANLNLITKSFVGKLRPNFLAMNQSKGKAEFTDFSEHHQLPQPKTSLEKTLQLESRKSFFSGHSIMGAYSAVFIIIFIHQAVNQSIVRLIFQVACFLLGIFPGITQHRHYWHDSVDVSCGYLLGAVSAFLSHFYVYT